MLVAPSLLSADFAHLSRDCEMLNRSACDFYHLDVMDGVFVPNISFGFPVMEAMAKIATKPLDVHLMIVEPQKFVGAVKHLGELSACGVEETFMNVHYEACTHLHRVIGQIRDAGMKAAVTLNPHTPVSLLEDIVRDVDMVLLMSVNPGFGGQKFIPQTLEKTARLKELILRTNSRALIEIDGGVNRDNAPLLKAAGADILVAGSSVFKSADPEKEIEILKA